MLGSLALHAGLFAVFWLRIPPRVVPNPGTLIEARLVPRLAASPAIAASPAAVQAPAPSPPQKSPAHRAPSTAVPAPVVEELPPTTKPELAGYLPIDAVDEPAVPLTDWAIDTDLLPRGYTLRVVLQLWISATGTIDQWALVDDGGSAELAHKALATLAQTRIRPAQLHLITVPSYRQLEVVLTRE